MRRYKTASTFSKCERTACPEPARGTACSKHNGYGRKLPSASIIYERLSHRRNKIAIAFSNQPEPTSNEDGERRTWFAVMEKAVRQMLAIDIAISKLDYEI